MTRKSILQQTKYRGKTRIKAWQDLAQWCRSSIETIQHHLETKGTKEEILFSIQETDKALTEIMVMQQEYCDWFNRTSSMGQRTRTAQKLEKVIDIQTALALNALCEIRKETDKVSRHGLDYDRMFEFANEVEGIIQEIEIANLPKGFGRD
jgi:hypothetical protein